MMSRKPTGELSTPTWNPEEKSNLKLQKPDTYFTKMYSCVDKSWYVFCSHPKNTVTIPLKIFEQPFIRNNDWLLFRCLFVLLFEKRNSKSEFWDESPACKMRASY